jgi:hypothetical protein
MLCQASLVSANMETDCTTRFPPNPLFQKTLRLRIGLSEGVTSG